MPMPPDDLVAPPSIQDQPVQDPALPPDRSEVRQQILQRFEAWLDEVLANEQPPGGITAEILERLQGDAAGPCEEEFDGDCDLYSLWSAITALTEETRLQGRSFKQLREELLPMKDLVGSASSVLQDLRQTADQQDLDRRESARRALLKDIVDALIDIQDRLTRGLDTAGHCLRHHQDGPRTGWMSRLWPGLSRRQTEAVQALIKGYSLARDRVDGVLRQIGVRPVECAGEAFDPACMKAVDIDDTAQAPEGMVLEVYRTGYWWDDAVHRPAEVRVARGRLQGGTYE